MRTGRVGSVWARTACRCVGGPGTLALLIACGSGESSTREPETVYSIRLSAASPLETGRGAILASANSIALDRRGRIYIGDHSDRRVKVFGPQGLQEEPIGAPGQGPGEIATLSSAGLLGDSAFAWDPTSNRLTVFAPDGRHARSVRLWQPGSPIWSRLRVMDDSLLVASGWIMGAHDAHLVGIFDREGRRRGKLMRHRGLLGADPELLQHTTVYADGSKGVVFTTVHGLDTLFAYSTDGRLLGAGRSGLTGHSPVLNLPQLIARNGGRLRQPDGTWAQDAHYAALKLVTLDADLVAVQFARLTLSEGGTDVLSSGGPIVVQRLTPTGEFRKVGQVSAPGALLGRSAPGEALILRWSGNELTRLELLRLTVTAQRVAER